MCEQSIDEHFVQLPGLRMHYVTCGDQDAEPVLLLHGFPEFWYSWRHQMSALAQAGFRAIAPDQRGYNTTDKNGPYDMETLVNDLAHLQQELGYARWHVVGHDWGGVVAWGFASYFPERLASLTTMNAPHPNAYMDAVRRLSRQIFKSWYVYLFQLPGLPEWLLQRDDYAAIRKVFRALPRNVMSDEDVQRYVDALQQPGALSAAIGWYRALPKQTLETGGSLPDPVIKVPTLVLWGERDTALDKECNATLDRYVPDLTLQYFPLATHWVQIDHHEEVNRHLIEFLQKHSMTTEPAP